MSVPISEAGLSPDEESNQIERIDFDEAVLVQDVGPDSEGPFLMVSGQLPCLNMTAHLVPVMYVQTPEYWVVHVYGVRDSQVCLEATRPFSEVLRPAPCGKKGITVAGATQTEQLDC